MTKPTNAQKFKVTGSVSEIKRRLDVAVAARGVARLARGCTHTKNTVAPLVGDSREHLREIRKMVRQ